MIEAEWWTFDDVDTMAGEAAGDIAFIIARATEQNGKAELAIPGGKTPIAVLNALAKDDSIDWDKVKVTLTDERIVSADDPMSNYAMIADVLEPLGATVEPLFDGEKDWDPAEAGRSADARLAGLSWPLDMIWLGMGTDGHTASIFPNVMDQAMNAPRGRRAIGVTPNPLPPEAPVERVTMTKGALTDAHTLIIVITGEDKKRLLERAIEDGPSSNLPIGRVLADIEIPVDIYWAP